MKSKALKGASGTGVFSFHCGFPTGSEESLRNYFFSKGTEDMVIAWNNESSKSKKKVYKMMGMRKTSPGFLLNLKQKRLVPN